MSCLASQLPFLSSVQPDAVRACGADVPMFGLAEKQEAIWMPDADEPILLDHATPDRSVANSARHPRLSAFA